MKNFTIKNPTIRPLLDNKDEAQLVEVIALKKMCQN